jgi:hypothetical protein
VEGSLVGLTLRQRVQGEVEAPTFFRGAGAAVERRMPRMQNRPVVARPLGVLACLSLLPLVACIRFVDPKAAGNEGAAEKASAAEKDDPRPLKPAGKELDLAQAALDASKWDEAIAHAKKAREILDAYEGRGYGSTEERHQHNQIRAEATLVGGLAHRGKGDPLGAFLFIDDKGFSAADCGEARKKACGEHEELMYKSDTFRGLTMNYSGQQRASLHPFFEVSLGNTTLSTTDFDMMKNFWYPKSDYLAIWVTSADANRFKSAVQGERATYTIAGSAHSITGTDCSKKVGEVEIGRARFDVKECHKGTSNYVGATLTFTMPVEDGKALDLTKSEALVIFRRKDLKQQGVTYSIGDVRLVRTRARR